ncbi:IS30 family transposase, partial [Chromohalobacter japonicus]
MSYVELSIEERATLQVSRAQGMSIRQVAAVMERSPSTICRERQRNQKPDACYCARHAQQLRQQRREVCRPEHKLLPGSERFELVTYLLRQRLSPEQIAGRLKTMDIPNLKEAYVCRETIYDAIYALPVGQLRKELIHCLRQGKSARKPRRGDVDRRGQIPDMVSIH